MKLLILFSFLFVECSTMNKHISDSNILIYENFKKEKHVLPTVSLLNHMEVLYTDSVLADKKRLLQPKQNHKIEGELFDALCQFDLINHWDILKESELNPYSDNYKEFIEKRKLELNLFYLGELVYNKDYKSFLILVSDGENSDYSIIRHLFLLNVLNNKVSSLTRVSSYTCFDGECNYIFTGISPNNSFRIQEVQESSDVIIPKEFKPDNEKASIIFTYDKKGRLKMF